MVPERPGGKMMPFIIHDNLLNTTHRIWGGGQKKIFIHEIFNCHSYCIVLFVQSKESV
jgi:hypothetical protein